MSELNDNSKKPTILIADDDLSTRILLRATISQWDYPVIEASNGQEAWDILSSENAPQIATIDWMMPTLDGLEICSRAKKLTKPPYIILLTNITGSSNVNNALQIGADDFLTKPFNFIELRSRLFVGQRIINYANKLEEIISSHKKLSSSNQGQEIYEIKLKKLEKIEGMIEKLEVMADNIEYEWQAFDKMMPVLEKLQSDEHTQLKNHILKMYRNQKSIFLAIKELSKDIK